MPIRYLPDFLFVEGSLKAATALVVDEDGRVLPEDSAAETTIRLSGKALLPALVNGHSHAFQRAIRGRTEYVAAGHSQDDFWSWRNAMYRVAGQVSPEQLYAISLQAFVEMAMSGISTVGEFHYLHHQPDGRRYHNENELGLQVIRAARDAGLRVVLLDVAYARAGFEKQVVNAQRRFVDGSCDEYLKRVALLKTQVQGDPMVKVGFAPHSVRAVPAQWLIDIGRASRGQVVHAHVSEQPAEVEACLREHQKRPVEVLAEAGLLNECFTAVHGIHLSPHEMMLLGSASATVCVCPSTERNLGDGIAPADALLNCSIDLSLGSDSQAHIDLLDEARQLEGHLRLLRLRRNVLDPGNGSQDGLAARLLTIATASGARSLGLDIGTLSVGQPADFFTVNLNHRSLFGVREPHLLASIAFASRPDAIADLFVAGRQVVTNGIHPLEQTAADHFKAAVTTL